MKDKMQTIVFGAALLYFSCYFMQLFGMPNIVMLSLGAILCLGMLITQKRIRIDAGICLLALSMLIHFGVLYGKSGFFNTITYVPMMAYITAHYAGCAAKEQPEPEKYFLLLLATLVLGHTIHGTINAGLYLTGHITTERKWLDIWTQSILAGTQQVVYFLPVLAVLFPALINFKKRKWVSALVVLATILFVYISLISKSRTSIMILVIVFGAQTILYLIFEREKVKQALSNRRVQFVGLIMLAILIAGGLFLKDTPVVRGFLDNMGKDGGIFHNVRFMVQREAIVQVFDHMWGGRQMELSLNYIHNVWLDMANASGSISFSIFTLYTILTIYELIRFLMKYSVSTEAKLITMGIYGAFFLYFMVEPALDASIHYLTPWFFVNGLVHSNLTKEKNKDARNCKKNLI